MKINLPPKGARKDYFKKVFFGSNEKRGIIWDIVVYVLLITIAFIYLYPVLYMLSRALMGPEDQLNSAVKWIPSTLVTSNFTGAINAMDYWNSLWKNVQLAVIPTIAQVFICSMVGYGFARYNFPGKMFWMGILLLSFLLPVQTTDLPNYLLMNSKLKLVDGSIKPFLIMALTGQGFKSVLCILIFFNFHRQVPQSLIEAAEIDGAGHIKAYFQIAIPLSTAAIVCVSLFSLVWYWNETYLVRSYLGYGHTRDKGLTTLMIELQKSFADAEAYSGSRSSGVTSTNKLNEAIKMAGTVMSIAPLLLLYLVLQKQFVESVDRAGITGE